MAKNLEITVEMLEKYNACEVAIKKFRKIFGEKVIINKRNILKAAKEIEVGDDWVYNLLGQPQNISIYRDFYSNSNSQWTSECRADEHDYANGNNKCKLRGIDHRIRCYTKFVELYKLENEADKN